MEFVAAINCGYQQYMAASHFLCEHLSFNLIAEDENSVTINNGVLSIRLHQGDQDRLHLHLDIEATDYRETINAYSSLGFKATTDHRNPSQFRVEQSFIGPPD